MNCLPCPLPTFAAPGADWSMAPDCWPPVLALFCWLLLFCCWLLFCCCWLLLFCCCWLLFCCCCPLLPFSPVLGLVMPPVNPSLRAALSLGASLNPQPPSR